MLGSFRLHERLRPQIPPIDELSDLRRQFADTAESSAVNRLTFDDPEPHLDEDHP